MLAGLSDNSFIVPRLCCSLRVRSLYGLVSRRYRLFVSPPYLRDSTCTSALGPCAHFGDRLLFSFSCHHGDGPRRHGHAVCRPAAHMPGPHCLSPGDSRAGPPWPPSLINRKMPMVCFPPSGCHCVFYCNSMSNPKKP